MSWFNQPHLVAFPHPSTLLQTARLPVSSPFSASPWESPTRLVPTAAGALWAYRERRVADTDRQLYLHPILIHEKYIFAVAIMLNLVTDALQVWWAPVSLNNLLVKDHKLLCVGNRSRDSTLLSCGLVAGVEKHFPFTQEIHITRVELVSADILQFQILAINSHVKIQTSLILRRRVDQTYLLTNVVRDQFL